jgi:hypothetical protein
VAKQPPAKKKNSREPPLNLSGVKFEDAMRRLANAPPMPTTKKK